MSGATQAEHLRRRRHDVAALAILCLCSTSFLGELTGIRVLKGVGAASGVAPLPRVFSARRGVETFAWELTLMYRVAGEEVELELTPEVGARLAGPYNRRNVYGALLAYGPLLPPDLRRSVARTALRPGSRLRRELGLPDAASDLRIRLRSKTVGAHRSWILDAEECREVTTGGQAAGRGS